MAGKKRTEKQIAKEWEDDFQEVLTRAKRGCEYLGEPKLDVEAWDRYLLDTGDGGSSHVRYWMLRFWLECRSDGRRSEEVDVLKCLLAKATRKMEVIGEILKMDSA